LLLAGGEPGAGPIDPLLFRGAAPADVWLHRRYNCPDRFCLAAFGRDGSILGLIVNGPDLESNSISGC